MSQSALSLRVSNWLSGAPRTDWRSMLGLWDHRKSQPLEQARYVVIDTELTGLNRRHDAVIALGAIRMQGPRILMGQTFYTLVNPERKLDPDNVLVHRIRPSELTHQPTIDIALRRLQEFVGDDVLVGHFVQLDRSFLNRDMQRYLGQPLQNPQVDTCQVSQWMDEQQRGLYSARRAYGVELSDYNLFALAERYHIHVQDAHHALYDAFLTARLWQRFLADLPALGVSRLGDALAIAGR
ncbi:MAG: 3'-5' exonuclease [Chloroflexi bacterium]|nr:3'-5' exonuclease [Chloroflexota bacterium]